jgi:hypothetical protein
LIGAEGAKTPRKCYRISFVRGRLQGSKINVLGDQRFRRDPAGVCVEEARLTPHGKRSAWSANQQAPNLFLCFFNQKMITEKIPLTRQFAELKTLFLVQKSLSFV